MCGNIWVHTLSQAYVFAGFSNEPRRSMIEGPLGFILKSYLDTNVFLVMARSDANT